MKAVNNPNYKIDELKLVIEKTKKEVGERFKPEIIEFEVFDDGMQNLLFLGDIVKVDVNKKNLQFINEKEVYLIKVDEEFTFRKIKNISFNETLLITLNKNCENKIYYKSDIQVIGKLVS